MKRTLIGTLAGLMLISLTVRHLPHAHAIRAAGRPPAPAPTAAPTPRAVAARLLDQPLLFAPNRGQAPAGVLFLSRGPQVDLRLDAAGVSMALTDRQGGTKTLRMRLAGASPAPSVTPERATSGRMNYVLGQDSAKWIHDVATYARVRYSDIYPGIDAIYYGNQRRLEYDFVVAPAADPGRIRLAFDGADRLTLGAAGELHVHVGDRDLREDAPILYQERAGARMPVTGRYRLVGPTEVAIDVDSYDHASPLVIDPLILGWSTYFGGEADDFIDAAAVNSKGELVVAGTMSSSTWPVTRNPGLFSVGGGRDVFVSRFAKDGSHLSTTMLGGRNDDRAAAIALDPNDNIYLTGSTQSLEFPTTANAAEPQSESLQVTFGIGPIKFPAINTAPANDSDAFVTRLDPTGAQVVYSTYLGGSPQISATLKQKTTNPQKLEIEFEANPGLDYGTGIAADAAGNAYVVGATDSTAFPVTDDAIKSDLNGLFDSPDGFITKIDTNGSGTDSIKFSSYLGGSCQDVATGVAIDGLGHVYVTGDTKSPVICGGFTTTPGAAHTSYIGGDQDVWAIGLILDPTLNPKPGVFFSTFLGTNNQDWGGKIGVDAFGNVYASYVEASSLQAGTLHLVKLSRDGTQQIWDKTLGPTVSGWDPPTLFQGTFFPQGLFVTPLSLTTPIFALRNDSVFGPTLEQVVNGDTGATIENHLGLNGGNIAAGVSADADRVYAAGGTSTDTLTTLGAVQPHRTAGLDGFAASLVYNQPPVLTAGTLAAGIENSNYTGPVATFVNPSTVPSGFSATIDWGDGTALDATAFIAFDDSTHGTIEGIHTYTDWGAYTAKACLLRQVDGLTTCAAFTATVADDPPHVTVANATVAPGTIGAAYQPSGTSGTQFSLTLNQIATFIDAGLHDTHTATVDWGDGSTSPVTIGQGQRLLPAASHVYSFAGTPPSIANATVCVTDRAGQHDCQPFTVQIPSANLSVALSGPTSANECDLPTYTMSLLNHSGSTIDNVTVTARLSDTAHASFASATFLGADGGADAASFATQLPATFPELSPGNPQTIDEASFGSTIAMSGDTAVVGSAQGSAHVYQFSTDTLQWQSQGELDPGTILGRTGVPATSALAIEGDVIVRGDSEAVPNETGSAVVYQRVNGVWTLTQQLQAHDAHEGNLFGIRVALHGSTMAVGGGGGAYIFAKQADGSWLETQHVGANGTGPVAFTDDGTTLFIGSPGDPQIYPPNQNAASKGTVWMYTLVNGQWAFQTKIVAGPQGLPPLVNIGDTSGHRESFGASLATEGDWLIVGAPDHTDNPAIGFEGAAYAFKRIAGTWTQVVKLLPSNPVQAQFFGITVSLNGGLAAIGTGVLPGCGFDCGDGEANDAYLFQLNNDQWTQISRMHPSFVGGTDGFGQAVAINAGRLIVGAPGKGLASELGNQVGATYAFGSCLQTEPGVLTCDVGRMGQGDAMTFGVTVAMGASIVPGAPSSATVPITLSASIAGGGLDPVTVNNQASVTTSVTNSATVCADTTAPIIAPRITGTKGQNDWYTSNVSLDWLVADPQSAFTTQGCDAVSLASDTAGVTSSCVATSAGGTATSTQTIRIDATPPSLNYTLTPGASASSSTVAFVCSDSGSGIAVCPSASPLSAGSAASFTATDLAGNSTTVTVDVPVVSAGPSLVVMTQQDACAASVTLQGAGIDAGGQPLSFAWTDGGQAIATGATPTVTLSAGVHHLLLTALNASGGTMTAATDVTVNTPPVTLTGGVDQMTVDATGARTPVTVSAPTATGCGVTLTSNLPADFAPGTSTVLFTATDAFNRSATSVTTVVVRPHVDGGISIPAAPIVAGLPSPYAFTVTNTGPSSASEIDVAQPLPAGVSAVTVDTGEQVCGLDAQGQQTCVPIFVLSPDAACATTTSGVKCSLFGVAPNETRTVRLSLSTPAGFARGAQPITASLTTAEPDQNAANDSATGSLTVTGQADLALSFLSTPGGGGVIAGTTAAYQLSVTNNGVSDASGFTIAALLGNGVTFASGSSGCAAESGALTCVGGPLAVGQQATFAVNLNVDPSARGTVTLQAAVQGHDVDPVVTNNGALNQTAITTDVRGSAGFAPGPANVTAGTNMSLTALFANSGVSDATGATAVVHLSPADVTVAATPAGCVVSPDRQTLTCAIARIPAGGTPVALPVTVSVGPFARGTVNASVSLIDAEESASHLGQHVIPIVVSVQPTLGVAAAPVKAVAGLPLTYTLTAGNSGPSGATSLRLDVPIPAGTTLTSASALFFAGSAPGIPVTCTGSTTVECIAATVGTNDRMVATVTVAVASGALSQGNRLAGTAAVAAAESATAVPADLGVDLIASADVQFTSLVPASPSIDAGATLLLTATVTNNGPSDATNLSVAVPIPADHSWQAPAPALQSAGCTANAAVITCSLGPVAAGAQAVHTFAITVDPSLRTPLPVSAQVAATETDPNPANNAASVTVQTTAKVTLSLTLSATPNPAVAGTTLSYALRVSNLGPSLATHVTAALTVPDGTTPGLMPAGCTAAHQVVTCSVPDTAPDGHVDLYLPAQIDQFARGISDALTAASTAHATETTADASASLVTPLTTRADVRVALAAGPNPVVAGNFLKYTATVTNDGPSGAIGATLTHALPSGVLFVSATGSGAACANSHGTVTCALSNISSGGSTTVTIVSVPSAAGLLTATSTVSVVENDPDLANNTAVATSAASSPAGGPSGLGDFNGDGALDLAVSDPNHDIVHIYLNDGQGHFVEHQQVQVGRKPAGLAIGDLDNDGHLDIAVTDEGSDAVSILRNDGTGTFREAARVDTQGDDPTQVALGDFDGDGRLDIAVINTGSDTVSLLGLDGTGAWTVMQRAIGFPTGSRGERLCRHSSHHPESIAVGDLNGDGRLDIVVGNKTPDSISILFNAGGWQFGSVIEKELLDTDDPSGLAIADFDNDGDLDIAAVGKDRGRVSLLVNAHGTFAEQEVAAPIEDRPVAIAAGDLDGDGQIDLAVAAGDDLATLLNGGGTFPLQAATAFEAARKNAIAMMIGDVNGDGRLDLVVVDDKLGITIWLSAIGPVQHDTHDR